MSGYSVPDVRLPFEEEDVARLERMFSEGRGLLPIFPVPERERLSAQLGQMVTCATLQAKGQVRRLLQYPIFVAYAEALLGRYAFYSYLIEGTDRRLEES